MLCYFIVQDVKPHSLNRLGSPFGMSNKPYSKNLVKTSSFYLRGRGGEKICNGILVMSRM